MECWYVVREVGRVWLRKRAEAFVMQCRQQRNTKDDSLSSAVTDDSSEDGTEEEKLF